MPKGVGYDEPRDVETAPLSVRALSVVMRGPGDTENVLRLLMKRVSSETRLTATTCGSSGTLIV